MDRASNDAARAPLLARPMCRYLLTNLLRSNRKHMASLEDFCILAYSRQSVNYFWHFFKELGGFFERHPVVGRFTKHHDVIWFGASAQ